MQYDIILIGAGAAGLWAGAHLPHHFTGLVLEKSHSPGKKLLMSGNGQCNLTHTGSMKDFLDHYGRQGSRLRSVLYPYNNQSVQDFFENLGLPLMTREDGKVFPKDLNSRSVLQLLLHQCKEKNTSILYDQHVTHLTQDPLTHLFTVSTATATYQSTRILVTTGGCSYPTTGSDGSFFRVLESLHITMTPCRPALVPVTVQNYPFEKLSGISFSNAKLTILDPMDKKQGVRVDDLLLTHDGFSGPLILNSSRWLVVGSTFSINYIPAYTTQTLTEQMKRACVKNPKTIVTVAQELTGLPKRFVETLLNRQSVSPQQKSSQCSGHTLQQLAKACTADTYSVTRMGGYEKAMVTAGGVDLSQVNLKTMESKEIPRLYFAGEVLDVDGDTGGYNLQFAFSSAQLAIESMTEEK